MVSAALPMAMDRVIAFANTSPSGVA